MTFQKNYDFKEEIIFLIAFSLIIIREILNITYWGDFIRLYVPLRIFRCIAYILLFYLFIKKQNYVKKDVIGILVILGLFILSYKGNGYVFLSDTAILIYFSHMCRFEKILKCTFAIHVAVMISCIVSSQIGVIPDVVWNAYGGTARYRHDLGYVYCGYPAHILLFLTTLWFCIRKKVTSIEVFIWLLLNFIMFKMTDSRTDFALVVLAMAGFGWIDFRQKRNKTVRIHGYMKFALPVIALGSIALQLIYHPEIAVLQQINMILSDRLKLGHDAIVNYGFSLFGKQINWIGMGSWTSNKNLNYNYVDNSFLKDLLSIGFVFFLAVLIGSYFLGKILTSLNDYYLCWAYLISLFYSVLNAHFLFPHFNIFILLFGFLFWDTSYKEPNQDQVYRINNIYMTMEKKTESFIQTAGMLFSNSIAVQSLKRVGRYAVIFLIYITLLVVQRKSLNYSLYYFGMYRHYITALLLLYSVLCYERRIAPESEHKARSTETKLKKVYGNKLLLLCFLTMLVADFVAKKQTQFLPFNLMIFGLLFTVLWQRHDLLRKSAMEFAYFYLFFYFATIGLGILGTLLKRGFTIRDIYGSAMVFVTSSLIAFTIFLTIKKIPLWIRLGFMVIAVGVCVVLLFKYQNHLIGYMEDYIINCRLYLKHLTLFGADNYPKVNKKYVLAYNSICLIVRRYGVVCGGVYLLVCLKYAVDTLFYAFKYQDARWVFLAGAGLVLVMFGQIEIPFQTFGWLYFMLTMLGFYANIEEGY